VEWEHHQSEFVLAEDLHPQVKKLIDPDGTGPRSSQAKFCRRAASAIHALAVAVYHRTVRLLAGDGCGGRGHTLKPLKEILADLIDPTIAEQRGRTVST
jgi:hypothetical protein